MSQAPRDGVGQFQGALDVTLDLPLASVGTRAMAHLIDLAVLFLIQVLVLAAFTLSLSSLSDAVHDIAVAAVVVASFLLFWGYFVACELLMQGQTPGKRVMGLRVVGRDGAAVDPVASMIRNLLRYADFLPGFYGVGVVAMLASARSQRVGDLAAGTVVVREARGGAAGRVRWPAALGAKDVALLEAWVSRAPHLLPEKRAEMAEGLLRWLQKDHPALLEGAPTAGPAQDTLDALVERWRETPGE